MPLFDFPLAELEKYLPERQEEPDFDRFWQDSLAEARAFPLQPTFEKVDAGLGTLETFDAEFSGYGGQRIKAWFSMPRHRSGPLPCVVEYLGYGGGRGLPHDWIFWSCVGYAYLLMDTRGQGCGWKPGATPDHTPEGSSPEAHGFLTRGILDPRTYYYRRLFIDAARAVEAARSNPEVDPGRVAITGVSQGGGIALAAGYLADNLKGVLPDVPFLCHYRRASELVDGMIGYREIRQFCQIHRDRIDQVFRTLSYFDGMNFAARSKAPALFSVALMDDICPPSTVFAAFNHYQGPKQIKVYHFNGHEGGDTFQTREKIRFLAEHL